MMDTTSLAVVAPEGLLLLAACVIALLDLGVKTRLRNLTHWLTVLTFAGLAWYTGALAAGGETHYAFGRQRLHGQLAEVLLHAVHAGVPGVRPALCG